MSRLKNNPPAEDKLRAIRVLYMQVYNDDRSLIPLAVDLFHVIGEILEGISPQKLEMSLLNPKEFLREISLDHELRKE
jgi:hypothetical protein